MNRPDYTGQAPPNKGLKLPAEPLTPDECKALLAACGRGVSGLRNRALIVVMWRGGLRVSEALALLPKDVDVDAGAITILRGKGAKRRVVGIDPEAMAVVGRWLDARAKLGVNGRHPLFCTIARDVRGGKMNSAYVREMVKERAAKAGIEKRVHPHGLRHTHAGELLSEGKSMKVIQQQLGHKSLATTVRYIADLTGADVVEAMQTRSWSPKNNNSSGAAVAQLLALLAEVDVGALLAQLGHAPPP